MEIRKLLARLLVSSLFVSTVSATEFTDLEASGRNNFVTPTRKVDLKEWPRLVDDLDFKDVEVAIDRQLERYKEKDLNGTIQFGSDKYSLTKAVNSLKRFKVHALDYKKCIAKSNKTTCASTFQNAMQREFHLYKPELKPEDPRYGEEKQTLYTAYYTPLIRGRTTRDARFKYGVYDKPLSPSLAQSTRKQIDFQGVLLGKGFDLFYSDDLFDLYLLHVQGGGRVLLENKSGKLESFYISYAGTNGQKWTFISKYMAEKGYIPNLSVEAQRDFLAENPALHEEVYSTCPSYVYFKKTDHPPLGNDGVSLTDNRSIATDTNYYKFKGLLAFVSAARPVEEEASELGNVEFKNFSRFFLDQDTGGAIKGKARVDLYFGEGPYAERAAYNIVQRGDLYFLMLK